MFGELHTQVECVFIKILTIHFLECGCKVGRVGKANKPIALCFASPLISHDLISNVNKCTYTFS